MSLGQTVNFTHGETNVRIAPTGTDYTTKWMNFNTFCFVGLIIIIINIAPFNTWVERGN